ncbi:hypothetical protein H9P43_004939 [Blastocladiella emersonii ATCC 22665]|nr:hypothetical protein H9P43_004939 [Blastocladiella emersonii ATCC 22665]
MLDSPTSRTGPVAMANSLILAYLKDNGFDLAHAAFLEQVFDDNAPTYLPPSSAGKDADLPPLLAVLEQWNEMRLARAVDEMSVESKAELDEDPDATINTPPTNPEHQLLDPPPAAALPMLHGANLLVAQRLVIPSLDPTHPILVSAAADRSLLFTSNAELPTNPTEAGETAYLSDTETLARVTLPAPALAIAQHPERADLLAVGCMDGTLLLLDAARLEAGGGEPVVARTKPHTKPCPSVVWARGGDVLVSGSYDRTVAMHVLGSGDGLGLEPMPEFTYTFTGAVESVALTPDDAYAVVAVRDSSDVYFCSTSTAPRVWAQTTHDKGTAPGHVAFTALHVARSPSRAYLAMATSMASGRVILWRFVAGTDPAAPWSLVAARNFYTGTVDEWTRPRIAWLATDAYFVVTADPHTVLVVATFPLVGSGVRAGKVRGEMYTTATQIVARLTGHTHVVRDVAFRAEDGVLTTASFDLSVRLWKVHA